MQVELDLPETLIRKMKALNILQGNAANAGGFEKFIVSQIEDSVTAAIMAALGNPALPSPIAPSERSNYYHDASEIAEGLGDDEPEEDVDEESPGPVGNMYELLPKKGGITNQDLDHDMDVEDPEHEAKAEALSIDNITAQKAEEIFSNVTGIPLPVEDDGEIDPRIAKRKKKTKFRARVVPATDETLSEGY